jgi:hypothetical protein
MLFYWTVPEIYGTTNSDGANGLVQCPSGIPGTVVSVGQGGFRSNGQNVNCLCIEGESKLSR